MRNVQPLLLPVIGAALLNLLFLFGATNLVRVDRFAPPPAAAEFMCHPLLEPFTMQWRKPPSWSNGVTDGYAILLAHARGGEKGAWVETNSRFAAGMRVADMILCSVLFLAACVILIRHTMGKETFMLRRIFWGSIFVQAYVIFVGFCLTNYQFSAIGGYSDLPLNQVSNFQLVYPASLLFLSWFGPRISDDLPNFHPFQSKLPERLRRFHPALGLLILHAVVFGLDRRVVFIAASSIERLAARLDVDPRLRAPLEVVIDGMVGSFWILWGAILVLAMMLSARKLMGKRPWIVAETYFWLGSRVVAYVSLISIFLIMEWLGNFYFGNGINISGISVLSIGILFFAWLGSRHLHAIRVAPVPPMIVTETSQPSAP